jgi:hypothetical protein
MGSSQLNAGVGPQRKGIRKKSCCLDKLLADFNDRQRLPSLDQVLPGLLEIVAAAGSSLWRRASPAIASAQVIRHPAIASAREQTSCI